MEFEQILSGILDVGEIMLVPGCGMPPAARSI